MASGKSTTHQNEILKWGLNISAATQPASCKIAFTSDNPTEDSSGTAITGTAYTSQTAVVFGAPSGGVTTGSSGVLSWANSSGSTWSISGAMIHDAASGHPTAAEMIYWTDAFTATVLDGQTLSIAINGITITEL